MAGAKKRVSFTRIVAGGLVLGAGGFGLLRATNAEPLPVPPPISVAEPRPDPNAPVLPKLDSFPLTGPAVPSTATVVPAAAPITPALTTTLPVPDLTPTAPLPVPAVPAGVPMVPVQPVPDLTPPSLPVPAVVPTEPVVTVSDVIPAVPALPKLPEAAQPAQPVVPVVPSVPAVPEKPEKPLRPLPAPLTLIPTDPVVPAPLKPESLPVGSEVLKPPRKVGDEIIAAPKPVFSIPPDVKVPGPLTITPGDAPMLSIHKLTLSTTLGVALALAPTSALKAEDPPKATDLKTVEEALKKEIKDLKDELKKSKDLLGSIDEQVMGRKDGKIMVPADAGLLARMEKLEKSIKALETKVDGLVETLSKRTVGSSPVEKNLVGKGVVKVVNEFATKISIVINDKSYPLDPSQTKEIEVPMGSFSYLLVSDGATKTTSAIKEGETVTLRIR